MTTKAIESHVKYFADLKAAGDGAALQQLVIGAALSGREALDQAHEALLKEAEEAGDNKQYAPAAEAFRKELALSWSLDDNRLLESASTQALYYGALTELGQLVDNFATVWALWAHVLPRLKARDRARLQDFARFARSIDLGLREREKSDAHVSAAVTLLVPTFEKLGALNMQALDNKNADLTGTLTKLWEEVGQLIGQIETAAAR